MNGSVVAYLLTPVVRECPVCKSTNAELLYNVGSEYAAQYYCLKELDPERQRRLKEEIERLWEGDSCRILRCRDCGFCFADPFVPGDSPFYSLFYDNPEFPKWKWEYEETYRQLKEIQGRGELKNPNVLEIGAGTGMFVQRIAGDITPAENILTIEYSEAGKNAIERLGIRSMQEDVRDLGEEFDGHFDVICMYQVLEHMNDLDNVFETLKRISSSAGQLFIAVPNSAMMTFYEEHDAWRDNAPVHVGRWNRRSFEIIGKRHQWDLAYHSPEPDTLLRRFLQFSLYRYVHHTKDSGTLYNWAESRRNRLLRYLFQVPLIGLMTLRSLPRLPELAPPAMGSSQLVRFVRHR